MDTEFTIRFSNSADSIMVKKLMEKHWGGEPLVIRGQKYYPSALEGIIAEINHTIVGFLFYDIQNQDCEIVVFEVFDKFKGIGTKMLDKLKEVAKDLSCKRVYLMTTNDNLDALRFYQRRGFQICGIHINSMARSRKIKPAIGMLGDYGISIRDEIDLEFVL